VAKIARMAWTVVALACAANAQDRRWDLIGGDREGKLYVDAASLKREGQATLVDVRVVPDEPGGWHAAIARVEVNCSGRTFAMRALEAFDAAGTSVKTVTIPTDRIEREPLYADSVYGDLYRRICPRGKPLAKRSPLPPPVMVVPSKP
jgi:hypothetical protein